jgi:hypothetical protein
VPENGISRNYFAKEKPVDQVHESVDSAGLVHHGPAAMAGLGRSPELGHSGAQGHRGRGGGRGVGVGEPVKGLTGGRAVTRWPGDGGKRQRRSVLSEVGVADSGASKGGRGRVW